MRFKYFTGTLPDNGDRVIYRWDMIETVMEYYNKYNKEWVRYYVNPNYRVPISVAKAKRLLALEEVC